MITIKFIILLLCVFIGYTFGYIFTETKYDLQRWRLFDFEAFKCRKCLSFHIAWVSTTIISTLFNDWIMWLVGMFFAFMLFVGLKIDESSRFENNKNNNKKIGFKTDGEI